MDHISATVITGNEEQHIERCLNSLEGVADEIIVVDSYSSDRTVEICRRYGCKITQRPFTGFGSQRQYAVGLVTYNFVLAIDADEVLSEDLRAELIRMKNEGLEHRVYSIKVINYFCGRPLQRSGWRPGSEFRLFNKRYANWNMHKLGERVTFDPQLMPAPIEKGHIDHYWINSIDEFERKEQRRVTLLARILASSNSSISVLTPFYYACRDFIRFHIHEAALLDGCNGNSIALRRSKTTFRAYKIARGIIKRHKNI